jgi:tetratricopeptide (TPR) repeat protein
MLMPRSLASRLLLPSRFLLSRKVSTSPRPTPSKPLPWREDGPDYPHFLKADNYAHHAIFTLNYVKRFIKFSFVGLVGLGAIVGSTFEAAHLWVEHFELAPETDSDVRAWEWDREAEKWSGGNSGGTDQALGLKGGHVVRAAWMAQNWGTEFSTAVISPRASAGVAGLRVADARLEDSQEFLRNAIAIAEQRNVCPRTLTELLTRHADVLERMGSRDALAESKSQLLRVWATSHHRQAEAARTALKLGDLSLRLDEPEDALSWWARAINLIQNLSGQEVINSLPVIPKVAPQSPLAQRILTSTLVSLSAFYAKNGQFKQAQEVEEASLSLLRSIVPPDASTATKPPQTLHVLYLLHRSSLLSIHLAEVLFALRKPAETPRHFLLAAASSSERVALALSGLPLTQPDVSSSPPASELTLLPAYASSISMQRPASSLLRDATRTAAEAWNLLGVLTEGESPEKALRYYERALWWVGFKAEGDGSSGSAGAGETLLKDEWTVLWGNYVRSLEVVRKGK